MLKAADGELSKEWKPLKVWDPYFKGGKLVLSTDEETLFCEYDGNVKIVKVNDPSNVISLIDNPEEYEPISTFCVHPNNQEIVTATSRFTLRHWRLSEKQCTKNIKAHKMPILCMEYDPTGTLVATGSADKSVRVWDIAKGYCTHSFPGHGDLVRSVIFHTNNSRMLLFSTCEDSGIRCFDLKQSTITAVFKEHVALPSQLAISKDGGLLVSAGRDKVVNVYDLQDLKHVHTVALMEELEAVAFLHDTRSFQSILPRAAKGRPTPEVLVTAGIQGVLKFFALVRPSPGEVSLQVLMHVSVSVAPTSAPEEVAALRGYSHVLALAASNAILAVNKEHNLCFYSIDEVTKSYAGTSQRSAEKTGQPSSSSLVSLVLPPQRTLVGSYGDILDLRVLASQYISDAVSPAFQLAVVSNSAIVRVVDDHQHCALLQGHSDIVLSVDSSPDGCWLVTSSKDHTARLWQRLASSSGTPDQWTCRAICTGHTEAVGSVSVSQCPATYLSRKVFLVTGAGDKVLKRFDLPLHTYAAASSTASPFSLHSVYSVRAHEKDINCVALSPNDALVATASHDKSVRVWHAKDLSLAATLSGHRRGVWRVSFSPVDQVLVSCSGDRTLKMWSLKDYSLLRTFEGHSASVLNTVYASLGQQVVSCAADGLLRVHTLRSGECEVNLQAHEDRVWALAALADEHNVHHLSTSSSSSTAGRGEEKEGEEEAKGEASTRRWKVHSLCSGGSDGKLILWQDVTLAEDQRRLAEREALVLAEQQLQNDLHHRRYHSALSSALKLKLQSKVLQILTTILEEENTDLIPLSFDLTAAASAADWTATSAHSVVGYHRVQPSAASALEKKGEEEDKVQAKDWLRDVWARRLDSLLLSLSSEQVLQMVGYLKDWNTNARTCYVSQVLLHGMLRLFPADTWCAKSEFREAVAGLQAYTERHYQRVHRLSEAAYYLDYLCGLASALVQPVGKEEEKKVAVVKDVQQDTREEEEDEEVREEKVEEEEKKEEEVVPQTTAPASTRKRKTVAVEAEAGDENPGRRTRGRARKDVPAQ